MAAHLEALSNGELTEDGNSPRLLINVPPGMMKSMLVSVLFPAWEWGPRNMPHMRYVCASHSQELAVRDNVKMRRLVESEWYQSLWGDRVTMTGDQNVKTKFENTATGFRQAVATASMTGARGDRVICFPYGELVETETGPVAIGDLVEGRVRARVWSTNVCTGKTSLKAIEGWHRNRGSNLLEIGLSDGATVTCTPDHRIWTARGWVEAQSLRLSDRLPVAPAFDLLNGAARNTILTGKSALSVRGFVDRHRLVGGEFGPRRAFASAVIVWLATTVGKFGPCFSAPYLCDGSASDRVVGGQIVSGPIACSYIERRIAIDFCARAKFMLWKCAVAFGICDVLRARPVFEVGKFAVSGISVDVANIHLGRSRTNKRLHDALVNEKNFGRSVYTSIKSRIAAFAGWIAKKDTRLDRQTNTILSDSDARLCPNSSHVADTINPLEPGDRFPVFIRDAGHAEETFCLSVAENHTFYAGSGNRVLVSNCDDPHSVEGATSDAERARTINWFLEAVPTRLNSPEKSAIVVIMQRLHEGDVSGVIHEKDLGYTSLILPMEYDPGRRCETGVMWRPEWADEPELFEDPREVEGELLFPERFPREVVERDKVPMGSYAVAGQFQQLPVPRGGGILRYDYWQDWDKAAALAHSCEPGKFPQFEYVLASVDTAYTEKQENDPSALTVWGLWTDRQRRKRVMLVYGWAKHLALHGPKVVREHGEDEASYRVRAAKTWGLVEWVADSCKRYRVDKLLIEAKASGISVAQEIRRLYAREDWSVQLVNPGSLDKVTRAHQVQPMFEAGMIYAPVPVDGRSVYKWAEDVKNECATFPKGRHDDRVDSTTQALSFLRSTGMLQMDTEAQFDIDQSITHRGAALPPIYPA